VGLKHPVLALRNAKYCSSLNLAQPLGLLTVFIRLSDGTDVEN
jgi:hypothetical protein